MVFVFLVNLLCAIVSCDPYFEPPTAATPLLEGLVRNTRNNEDNDLFERSFTRGGRPEPLVVTNSGIVEGYFMTVVSGRQIYSFEGIPYAESPEGPRRFQAPVAKAKWSGVLRVKSPGSVCLQMHLQRLARVIGKEDCLTLSIYSPQISTKTYNPKFPVIIFVHGGSFFFGSGSEYGPAYLLKEDVILVTINYRVGVLGFLSTGDEQNPGNWGIKDQIMAFNWVKENIEKFGGDSKRITLMGQSAGGVATHLHMITNHTAGIFQQAISLSSSAFVPWAIFTRHQARKWAEKFASKLGCPVDSGTKVLMDCVKGRDPNFVVANQIKLFDLLIFPPVLLRPAVEPDIPGAFITEMPEKLYEKGQVHKIPWITTSTTEEAEFVIIYLQGLGVLRPLTRRWHQVAPAVFDYGRISANSSAVTAKIVKFYLGDSDPRQASAKIFSDIGSDRYFTLGNRKAVKLHAKVAPTYSYIFGFRSGIGLAAAWGNDFQEFGVPHGEDLFYVFNSTLYSKSLYKSDPGTAISKLVVNLFTNFANKGVPLYTGDDGKEVKIWHPITDPDNPTFLQINEEVKMISDPFKDRVRFWKELALDDTLPYDKA